MPDLLELFRDLEKQRALLVCQAKLAEAKRDTARLDILGRKLYDLREWMQSEADGSTIRDFADQLLTKCEESST